MTLSIDTDSFPPVIWKAVREINAEMFHFSGKPWKPTVWGIVSAAASVTGVLVFYWTIPNAVAAWLFYRFYDAKTAKDAVEAWQLPGSHAAIRFLAMVAFFVFIYLVVFAVYAVQRLDYRKQLARIFGVRFSLIRREHTVLNLDGDCLTTSKEVFLVDELQMAYIERRLQAPANVARSAADITVSGLPQGTTSSHNFRDAGPTRTYEVNFTPPLHQTAAPVSLVVTETIEKAIYMTQATTPVHPIFKSKMESISLLVMEPVDCLELSVRFPSGYFVGGASQLHVCYGRTPTIHDAEEQRLKNNGAITSETGGGQQTFWFHVDSPIVGLQYYLYWEPL